MTELRDVLREHLRHHLAARDRDAVAALRTAIAAIDNAEAQPVPETSATEQLLGPSPSAEVPRRTIADAEAEALVRTEIEDLRDAAGDLRAAGRDDSSARADRQADVLAAILGGRPRASGPEPE
ncbi:MAG: hypothetical protein KDA97_12000 [Acidimicrobiales bacterium]|nr:hypothetical protein [Acidimicrobiales bacterium]